MNKVSQWVGCILTTWFTWLIYTSNTHYGAEWQSDLVAFIVFVLAALALMSCLIESKLLLKLKPKTLMIKMWADVNILAQVGLLLFTGHWVLSVLRGGAEVVVRANVWLADRSDFTGFI